MSRVLSLALVATALVAAASTPSLAKPPPKPVYYPVSGSVIAGPCAEASAKAYDPVTGRFQCQAIAYVDGTWSGTATIRVTGTINPVTGNASGVIDEVLDISTADNRKGQLHLVGSITVNGTTGESLVNEKLVGGSGPFRRAKGTVISKGYMPITGGPSTATYKGTWTY